MLVDGIKSYLRQPAEATRNHYQYQYKIFVPKIFILGQIFQPEPLRNCAQCFDFQCLGSFHFNGGSGSWIRPKK